MDKILSPEEISALFSAMSTESGRQEAPPVKDGAKVINHDFHRGCRDEDRIVELVKPIHLPVSCEIRGSKLTVEDLLGMSVGDIIKLKDHYGDPVVLCVGGVPKFTGKVIQRRGMKVFSVSGRTAR